MFGNNKPKEYNPFMATKRVLEDLRAKTKKGSTYVNNFGQEIKRSDFDRGVAMGRYQLLCEQAKYYNEHNLADEKKTKKIYKPQGFEHL